MLWLLLGCGLDQYLGPPDDPSDGPPGRRDPPSIDALEPYRNEDTFLVTGLIAPDDDRVVVSAAGETTIASIEGGAWSATITIPRGQDVEITASNGNGESTPATTQACDPWDAWELDPTFDGNTCDEAIVISQALYDNEDREIVIGNILGADEADWYFVHTIDEPVIENNVGYENYHFVAELVKGIDAYQISVFKGACNNPQCPETPEYTTYEWFMHDDEPDEDGMLPPDPRSCGEAPLDPCPDWSESYWIKVQRSDGGADCKHYELELSNGIW